MKPPLTGDQEGEISENIEALKQQVEFALKNVDEGMIDSLLVGQTTIQKNKAVILSWSMEQQQQQENNSDMVQSVLPTTNGDSDSKSPDDDGIVLYVAIKMKKKQNKEEEEGDPNNNMTEK